MKKLLPFILIALLAASLCACGSRESESSENNTNKESGSTSKVKAKKKDHEDAAKAFIGKVMSGDYDEAYEMLEIAGEPFITEQDFEDYIPKSSLKAFAGDEMSFSSADTELGEDSATVTLKYGAETVKLDTVMVDGKILVAFDEFAVKKWDIKAFIGTDLTLNGVSVNDNARSAEKDGYVTYRLNYAPKRTVHIEMDTAFGKKMYRVTPEKGGLYDLVALSTSLSVFSEWLCLLNDEELTGGTDNGNGTITYCIPCESGQSTKADLQITTSYTVFKRKIELAPGNVIEFGAGFYQSEEMLEKRDYSYTELAVGTLIRSFVDARRKGISLDEFREELISSKLSDYDRDMLAKVLYEKVMALESDFYDFGLKRDSRIIPRGNETYEVTFGIDWDTCSTSGSFIFSVEDTHVRVYACDKTDFLEPRPDPDFK